MAVEAPFRAGVLMGDIVGSEDAQATRALHAAFNAAIDDQNDRHMGTALVSPLTITLGDEFQGLATGLRAAFGIATDVRRTLLSDGIDCRFVIGEVRVETPINPDRAWNMLGPGFGRARDKLNEKKRDTFYRFSLDGAAEVEVMLDALGAGLSLIEREWTDQQREDIAALLRGDSAKEIAQRRDVSVHSVYKVRASGNYDVYVQQWDAIARGLDAIDRAGEQA